MSQFTRTPEQHKVNSGIYLGKVVNHLDGQYMGTLEVEILKAEESGNFANYIQCKYASPFQGATPLSGITNNDGYDYTQKSYGFWAVPPDIGTLVIVVMPEGNYGNAYWIGCVADLGMNFMTPGYSSTTYNDSDRSTALPVGEYNKRVETGAGTDPTKYIKPTNTRAVEALEAQGLKEDHIRGTNTSSARREVPSMVFGISTPGPQDRAGPTHRYGKPGGQVNAAFSRLGGSSFVMDDGDMSLLRKGSAAGTALAYASVEDGETDGDKTLPANELIRIKTRTGHQILLHNTEDLIYISHGSGNSWIEMTANGKIDIYAKDSISVHSENDINFKADRDINFEAGRNFNFSADGNFYLHTLGNWELKAEVDGRLTAGATTHITADRHKETAPQGVFMNSESAIATPAGQALRPVRIPQHEPWSDHENLDPSNFAPKFTAGKALTEAAAAPAAEGATPAPVAVNPESTGVRKGAFLNGTTDEASSFPTIPDTFKKPT
jgi:hypothetical protein